jgi:hypothetical protein
LALSIKSGSFVRSLYLYVVFNTEKRLNIPKEFTLFGHKYKVQMENDLFEKEDCYGCADEDLKLIRLQILVK